MRKEREICITHHSHQLNHYRIIDIKSSLYSHHLHTSILTSVGVIESDAD